MLAVRFGFYVFLPLWGYRHVVQFWAVARADRYATLLSEGLGEVVCPYKRVSNDYLMRSTVRLRKASRAAPFSMPFCNRARSMS